MPYQTERRPVGDFFGPFFRVAFLNPTGATNEVSTFVGSEAFSNTLGGTAETDQDRIDARYLSRTAATLSAESKAGSPFKFTVELTPTYDDAVRILNRRLITFGTLVKVQWGYATHSGQHLITGNHVFRNMYPQANFGEDIRITLSGIDLASDFALRNTSTKSWDRATYPTDQSILEALVSRVGYELDIFRVPANSTLFVPQTDPSSFEQHVSDIALIKRICRDHGLTYKILGSQSGKQFFVVFDILEAPASELVIAYDLMWRTPPRNEYSVPLYSVNGNILPHLFQPPAGRGLLAMNFDPDTNTTRMAEINGREVSTQNAQAPMEERTGFQQMLADRTIEPTEGITDPTTGNLYIPFPRPTPNEDTGNSASEPPPPSSVADRLSRMENLVRESTIFSHPIVKVKCPGVVDIFPGIFVRLVGASELFDGVYTVLGVKHTVSFSGYDMEIELIRPYADGGNTVGPPVTTTPTQTPTAGAPEPTAVGADAPPPIPR